MNTFTDNPDLRHPELNHPNGWEDNAETNLIRIYDAIEHYRNYMRDKGKGGTSEVTNEVIFQDYGEYIPSLDYAPLATIVDKAENVEQSIRRELVRQLLESRGEQSYLTVKHKEPQLTTAMVGLMLSLIKNGIFSSVCLAEIALLNFVNYDNYAAPEGDSKNDKLIRGICSKLSNKALPPHMKLLYLRHVLGNPKEHGVIVSEPTQEYIAYCEDLAEFIIGEEPYNRYVVPAIETAAWALDTTGCFGYSQYGFTQYLRCDEYSETSELFQEFMPIFTGVVARIHQNRRGLPDIPEFKGIDFTLGLIRDIYSIIAEQSVDPEDPLPDRTIEHEFARNPLSSSILAEVTSGKFFYFLDKPSWFGHNCTVEAEDNQSDQFLHHSPAGYPDAQAVFEEFIITIEVSTAKSKSNLEDIGYSINDNFDDSFQSGDEKVTTYYNDMVTASDHIIDAAIDEDRERGNNPDSDNAFMKKPKYVFMVTKRIPNDKESLRMIQAAAESEYQPTIIPITFSGMVEFIKIIERIAQKNDKQTNEIEQKELLGMLKGIEKVLADIDLSKQVNLASLPETWLDEERMNDEYHGNEGMEI